MSRAQLRIGPEFMFLFLAIPSILASRHCPEFGKKSGDEQTTSSTGGTFLWSIDSPSRTARSFLFGTIHVPYDRVWDHVSTRVKQALDAAQTVVFELELKSTDTVERLARCKLLDAGLSLRDVLPSALFDRLRAFMHRLKQRMMKRSMQAHEGDRMRARNELRRMFPGDWEHRRPVWLLFLLFQLGDLQQQQLQSMHAGIRQAAPMLDLHLAQLAQAEGKQLLSMESAAEQCDPLQMVGDAQLQFAINYTLDYLEWTERRRWDTSEVGAESPLDALVEQYKCGTLGAGMDQAVFGAHRFARSGFSAGPAGDQRAREVDNLLVEDILLRRNERMARRADLMLRSRPSTVFFFALGAGHLLGHHRSMLSHLRQLGYWLAPVGDQDQIRTDQHSLLNGSGEKERSGAARRRISVRIAELPDDTVATAAASKNGLTLAILPILLLSTLFFVFL